VPKRPDDLVGHQCVTVEPLTVGDNWVFRVGRKDVAVQVKSRLVISAAEAAVDAAVAGVGITRVLSYQMAEAGRAGRLKVVLVGFEPPPISVSLVFNGQQRVAFKLRNFLDLAASALRTRLSASD
jgi:DNA-binding transcriptional LysR family regulator